MNSCLLFFLLRPLDIQNQLVLISAHSARLHYFPFILLIETFSAKTLFFCQIQYRYFVVSVSFFLLHVSNFEKSSRILYKWFIYFVITFKTSLIYLLLVYLSENDKSTTQRARITNTNLKLNCLRDSHLLSHFFFFLSAMQFVATVVAHSTVLQWQRVECWSR